MTKQNKLAFLPTIQPATVEGGFTQSELSLMDECALKWNYRYNNMLQKDGDMAWPLFVGQAWHNFQQRWRESKGNLELTKIIDMPIIDKSIPRDTEFEKRLEYWSKVLPAYQQAYARLYKGEEKMDWFLIEKELSAEFLGFKIRGKIDLAQHKAPRFIRDFKSTASTWLMAPSGWHFKLQFMLYCWLMWKEFPEFVATPFDFQLDMMQKPALKETKADGSWAGHIQRVCLDVQKRAEEFYLSRETKKITVDQIKHFENHVLAPKIQRLALAMENPGVADSILTNPNTNACHMFNHQCEFFELCEKGWDAGIFFFVRRPTKHAELD